ncbi:MAG: hypothetical protein H6742_09565 [Alphaproteobacteria bacterium]|nr:hypothetical protein [Alphaproteobacteria bacterium]
MSSEKQQPSQTPEKRSAEDAPTPPETEARELAVDDVEAGQGVKGGAVYVNGTEATGAGITGGFFKSS